MVGEKRHSAFILDTAKCTRKYNAIISCRCGGGRGGLKTWQQKYTNAIFDAGTRRVIS